LLLSIAKPEMEMDDVIRRELHAQHKARCPPTSQKWNMDRDNHMGSRTIV